MGSQVAPVEKKLPANAGDARDASSIPGWEDPLEEEMAIHSSILVWEITWSLVGYSPHSCRELDTTERTSL